MKTNALIFKALCGSLMAAMLWNCKTPNIPAASPKMNLPKQFGDQNSKDSIGSLIQWSKVFQDSLLVALIDSGLHQNRELLILQQESIIRQSEVLEKKGEYLPFLTLGAEGGLEKPGRYTRAGAVEENLNIEPGKAFPEPMSNLSLGATASWEVDLWKKLRNARDAAKFRAAAQLEAQYLFETQLVAEIAAQYVELLALDKSLFILNENLLIQRLALEKVRELKRYAKANQLAVNRFEAQWLNTQNRQFALLQKRTQAQNKLRVLTGNFPDSVARSSAFALNLLADSLHPGVPTELLQNRPDIRQKELELKAAQLDIKVARAAFYPKLDLRFGLGFEAFNPSLLFDPRSLVFNAAGGLMAPLVNRKALQAQWKQANAKQIQALYEYEQTLLQACTDVLNQLTGIENAQASYSKKLNEVAVLTQSIEVANDLFYYAKADYVEVLLTQEEALNAQIELIDIQKEKLLYQIGLYKALGGGWR